MARSIPSQSYRTLAVETASPGRLILMLFDGAVRFLGAAEAGFEIEELRERRHPGLAGHAYGSPSGVGGETGL